MSENGDSPGPGNRMSRALRAGLQRLDDNPRLLKLVRLGRSRLPGDERYGDPLSLTGDAAPAVLGRRLSALTSERPGALREVGMSALQVWQGVSEAQGRGRGDRELTIVFTDLADFSTWALDAGDTQALALLRDVGEAVEPEICSRGGQIVKRLGDGLMAVFEDPGEAIEAACAAAGALESIEIDGHSPRLRAGVHTGRPRRLGGDYFGVDVNVAARVAEAAAAGEVLISDAVHRKVEGGENVQLKRRWRFSAKGAPKGLKVYAAESS
jgi:adenylate cyclase